MSPYIIPGLKNKIPVYTDKIKSVRDLNGAAESEIVIKTIMEHFENDLIELECGTFENLIGKDRTEPLPYIRMLIMTFLKKKTRLTFKAVGKKLGGRDHTTVIHATQTIDNLMFSDPNVLRDVRKINALLM